MYSLKEYFEFAQEIYSTRGITGVYKEGTSYLYESFLRSLNPLLDKNEEYVLDKEWDVLIILDACRVDLLEEVADEYHFLPDPPINHIRSAGSYSEGWLRNNFTGEQAIKHRRKMKNTIHVSGNPFTKDVFDGDEFQILDEVWEYGWGDDGYLPPKVVTDQSIRHHRSENPDHMIIHYMQPHAPFISQEDLGYSIDIDDFASPKGTVQSRTPWELLRDGEVTETEVWTAYKETLRAVLDSVEVLLDSINADTVVISADHGNAIGEKGIYGHPRHLPLSCLRNVPWVKTSANDNGEYNPEEHNKQISTDREEQLEQLGYK